jgi:16S rRNA (adenine1518-N6/adenine1519-N6)-dimethyltransferase
LKPKKKFGQHFLTSQSVIAHILEASGVQRGDCVLEIGPGQGALTKSLVEIGAVVTVIEIDPDMQSIIRTKFPSVRIIDADASSVNFSELLDNGQTWKCLSNLPYNVGTKIVQNLLMSSVSFSGFTFMLQKEVGVRMLASQGDRVRGSLSNFVQAFGSVSKVCLVPPGAFFPPPNVDSIVIQIVPFQNPLFHPCSIESFEMVNRALFAQPRKSLRNSLKKTFSKGLVTALDDNSPVDFGLRPAQLSLPQVVDLVKVFEKMHANG